MSGHHVEPELAWLGGRRFWQTVAVLAVLAGGLVGGRALWLGTRRASAQEAFVFGQTELTPGVQGRFRVLVRDGRTATPTAEARVRVALLGPDGARTWSGEARTDAAGVALVETTVPATAREGAYRLVVDSESEGGSAQVAQSLTVKRSFRVLLTTDKPLYQPGQVIHLRALALASLDLRPVAGLTATLEVKDGKGNKVFKKIAPTSDFGLVAADFVLADQVNTGSYAVVATVGDTSSERTVTVDRYVLPRFGVEIQSDRGYHAPGETIEGAVLARYTFGEPVARGKVRLAASEYVDRFVEFAVVEGETDASGRFAFSLPLKQAFAGLALKGGDALVSLEATVVDRAGHRQVRTRELTVTPDPIRIDLVPESGQLVPGVENLVWVVTSYPDGRPARTTVQVTGGERIETSEAGIARLKVTPSGGAISVTVTATEARGATATATRQLEATATSLLLRPDRAVYAVGDTVRLSILAPGASGRAFVDIVKTGRTVLTQGLDLAGGRGVLALDLPPDLFGTLELRAYRLLASGDIAGDTRIVQVTPPEGLRIAVALDKPGYRPGDTALLRFAVTRPDGTPAVAALGLSAVDEAVFALQEMRPGLERVFFMLQEELLKPRYEIHASVPPATLASQPPPEARPRIDEAAGVVLSAASGGTLPARARSQTFAQRQVAFDAASRAYRLRLASAALLAPAGLLALLGLPFVLYIVLRLVRRRPLADLSEDEVRLAGKAIGSLEVRFVLGFYGAVAATVAAGLLGGFGHGFLKPAAVTIVIGVFVLAFLLLVTAARRLRRLPAAADVPLVRKLAALVPLVFLLVPPAVLGLVAASSYPWKMPEGVIVRWLVAGGATLLVVVAALAVARACATRAVAPGRFLAIALSRPLLAALPLGLLVAAVWLPTRFGRHMGPMAMREELDMVRQQALPAAAGMPGNEVGAMKMKGEAKDDGQPLKEPTRVRRYFPETLLWVPELITGGDGRATLEVPLADSITTWRLAASAVTAAGELGAAEQGIRVFQDFFVDLDLPVALTQHDEVSVPVAVYSYLSEPQTVRLELQPGDWYELRDEPVRTLRLGPRDVTSVYFRIVANKPGRHALTLKAAGSVMADAVEREVRVAPDGEEVTRSWNGTLEKGASHRVDFPAEAVAGASDLFLKIYPGAFSQVVEGLDAILRMPGGCFEQTSSSTYPNVLALAYLRSTKQVKPEVELKALQYINTGYQRLLSFEVPGGGFSWFGQVPAHNVLTAYGVLEFADMAKVYEIDLAVLERTARWLASEQQSDGSWQPTEGGIAEGAINQYQGQVLRTTAYIAWALAEAGQTGDALTRAMGYLHHHLGDTQDPYTLAVGASALAAAKDGGTRGVLDRLLALKKSEESGIFWSGGSEGAVHSRGEVLDIETTAIAAHALITTGYEVTTAHKALAWLLKHKDAGGTWHSTQATVHAMRALLAGTGPGGAIERPVGVTIIANGKAVQELTITPETSDVLRLVSLRERLAPTTTVTLETNGGGSLAYQLVAVHYLPWQGQKPQADKEMRIDVAYDTASLRPDDTLTCSVTVRYNRPGEARMTIVDLGVPPGFEVVTESMDALKQAGTIQRFSLTGRQVILYFDRLPGMQDVRFALQMKAKFPVRAKTPPTTVYQYYEPGLRDQAPPTELVVAAR